MAQLFTENVLLFQRKHIWFSITTSDGSKGLEASGFCSKLHICAPTYIQTCIYIM